MSIISTLPFTLTNGSEADASQVMANFNQIVSQVNSNVGSSILKASSVNVASPTVITLPANSSGSIYVGNSTSNTPTGSFYLTQLPGYVGTVASLVPINGIVGTIPVNFASTYNNGASGVGATLTATSNGVFNGGGYDNWGTITNGDSVLISNQTVAMQNGIYVMTDQGSVSTPAILTRRSDFDGSVSLSAGMFASVTNGDIVVLNSPGSIVIGVTDINFIGGNSSGGYSDTNVLHGPVINYNYSASTQTYYAMVEAQDSYPPAAIPSFNGSVWDVILIYTDFSSVW